MRYFDTHTHVISPDTDRYPHSPLGGKQSDWSKERHVSDDELVAALNEGGVERAVVVHASTVYGYNNHYVADTVAKYPDRLVGVGSVDFRGEHNAEDLAELISRTGIVGCRIFTTGTTMPGQEEWLDDASTYRAWGLAAEKRIPVVLNMKPSAIPQVVHLLNEFPGLVVVLDHGARPNLEGGPPYREANDVFSMSDFENVFLKFSTWSFQQADGFPGEGAAILRALCDHFGADRIAWGSNFPSSQGKLSELVKYAEDNAVLLSEKEREWFFSRTAARIYPKLELSK